MTSETYGRKFGRRLRFHRDEAGMTTAQLANAAGISQWSVKSHMSGRHLPDAHMVAIYAMILGVTPDDLLPRLDSNQQPTGSGIAA